MTIADSFNRAQAKLRKQGKPTGLMPAFPETLSPLARKLRHLHKKQRSDFFGKFFELGLLARREIEAYEKKSRRADGHVFDELAAKAGIDVQTLRNCISLVEVYSLEDFTALATEPEFTWRHFVHLIAVVDPVKRAWLANEACRNQWDADTLCNEILHQTGYRATDRRPKFPPSPTKYEVLRRIRRVGQRFQNGASKLLDEVRDFDDPETNADDLAVRRLATEARALADLLDDVARQSASLRLWLNQLRVAKDGLLAAK